MTSPNLPSTSQAVSSTADRVPDSWIDEVFARLTAQLGVKVADLWAGADPDRVRSEWAEALAAFDPSEIRRGLAATRARTFAPTLGEFLRLCRPALDPEAAWIEACECMRQRDAGEVGDWTHPGVYRAARDMAYELRTSTFKQNSRRWTWMVERELRRGWLMAVPKPAPRIEHDADKPTRPPNETERAALANLRARCTPKQPEVAE